MPKRIGTEEFISRNRDFHCAVFNASGNMRMASVARELIEQMDRMTLISIHTIKGRDTSELLQEHCRIIDALQARKARFAAKLMREHVSAAAKRMLKGLRQSAVTT
jgi:DNA-binding GntR family transcriptional regulator